jgi:3-phosphoshikimate 1-carboxyvinyltransferase
MSDAIAIQPAVAPVRATVRPPGSKSITNRALVCAALADGVSTLTGPLECEDTAVMTTALRQLGIAMEIPDPPAGNASWVVNGCHGQVPAERADLYVANSGTTMRFLTALLTLGRGHYRLHGTPRMHQRPIQDLLDALRQLGGDARSENDNRCPPVVLAADGLTGGTARVHGNISSQYLSALLMAAPCARQEVVLEVSGPLVSVPYVAMTCRVMRAFGIAVQGDIGRDGTCLRIAEQAGYRGTGYAIEPDASAASYFLAAAAITGGEVTVVGLSKASIQGDIRFCELLERMGCEVRYAEDQITVVGQPLHGIDAEMNAISDTVQTLAAVALFAQGATRIRDVGHIRHKETDRIGDLATELRKLGASVEQRADGMTIVPGPLHGARIVTYDDHRMAMSLALVGLQVHGVLIENPECTRKTYPDFFDELKRLTQ